MDALLELSKAPCWAQCSIIGLTVEHWDELVTDIIGELRSGNVADAARNAIRMQIEQEIQNAPSSVLKLGRIISVIRLAEEIVDLDTPLDPLKKVRTPSLRRPLNVLKMPSRVEARIYQDVLNQLTKKMKKRITSAATKITSKAVFKKAIHSGAVAWVPYAGAISWVAGIAEACYCIEVCSDGTPYTDSDTIGYKVLEGLKSIQIPNTNQPSYYNPDHYPHYTPY